MVRAMTPVVPAAYGGHAGDRSRKDRQMANLREFYLQAIEAYNAHDLDGFLNHYADDCAVTVPGFPPFEGKAAVRECWRLFMESFPDDHLTVTNQVVDGTTV